IFENDSFTFGFHDSNSFIRFMAMSRSLRGSFCPLLLISMKQNHFLSLNHHVKNPMGCDFDFPELAFDLPKLYTNSIEPVALNLVKRFKYSRTFRFGQMFN